MIRRIYACLTIVFYPLICLWLKRRAARGKEVRERLRERLGYLAMPRPEGALVWFHAASVGESMSLLPLIEMLHEADEGVHMVITTGTVSSAKLLSSRLPARAYHQFVPVDAAHVARRFVRRLRPDMAVWVESELWPNLMHETRRCKIPMLLVNARISQRSYRRWRYASGFFTRMMACFDVIYAGSPRDKQFLHQLGVPRVEWSGNLKYDAKPLAADPELTAQMLTKIGDRRVWLAASTHEGEEEYIVRAHQQIREVYPEILTVIVPRHPHRAKAIAELFARNKLTVAQRSKNQIVLPETDIYLADTLGELGIFYRFAGAVFLGGSLVAHGGHNPIEPAQLDCAIVCGPHMHNFADIIDDLKEVKAIHQLETPQALGDAILELLRDHEAQEKMAARAHEAVDSRRGATNVIAQHMMPLLGVQEMAKLPDQEEEICGE